MHGPRGVGAQAPLARFLARPAQRDSADLIVRRVYRACGSPNQNARRAFRREGWSGCRETSRYHHLPHMHSLRPLDQDSPCCASALSPLVCSPPCPPWRWRNPWLGKTPRAGASTGSRPKAESQGFVQPLGCEPSPEPTVNLDNQVAAPAHPGCSLFGTLSCVSDLVGSPIAYAAARGRRSGTRSEGA